MSLQSIDLSKKVPKPTLWLSKPNKTLIGKLDKYIYNIAQKSRLRDTNELSFSVPFEISAREELKRNPNVDKIKVNFLIKFVYNGSTEWYKITKISKNSNNKDELSVTALSLEFELSQKKMLNYSVVSYNCTQVLTDLLSDTRWSILNVDSSFDQSFRDFEFSSKSSLDALLNDITFTFKGSIVTFDTENRKVSVVKESSVGQDRGLRIVYSQYMTDINEESSTEQITTRLYPYGKDNLGIERVNSSGLPYVQDFSYYTNADYMTDSLITAVNDYNTLLNSKAPIDDVAEAGTTATNLTLTNHGLTVGSYIVNRSRNRATRKVVTVVDSSNITISSITGQIANDTILKYPSGSFGKLLFEKEDLQADLKTKNNELDTLKLNKLTVLDRISVQLQAKTIDTFSNTVTNTSVTRTLSGLNSVDKYVAMVRISTTTGTTVTLNSVSKTFTTDSWTVIGKVTSATSHSVVVTTTGTNVNVKILIVKTTESEYTTTGNESVLIDTYSEDYKQTLIDSKQAEINTINSNITSKDAEITTMKNSLSMAANFTTAQLDELKDFIYEDEFRDDNLIDDKDILDASIEEIKKRNSPQVLYKTGVADFLSSITEQRNWKKLNLGDTVNAAHKKLKIDIKTKITEIERDFESKNINITISSDKDVLSIQSRAIKSLYKSIETTNNLNVKKSGYDTTKTNFTKRNDRISVVPANPTILSDGTAIDHVINDDGSVDISFEWSYTGTGDAYDIDGFTIYTYSSPTDIRYIFGSTISGNEFYNIPHDHRSFMLQGVPANKYYNFGIQAYRVVDEDVNSNGVLKSDIVQPSLSTENPYRPESNVAFAGNITGTISGTASSTVVSNAANGQTTYTQTANGIRNGTAITDPSITLDGTAIDHVINTDGSSDISFEWVYTEPANSPIDGFGVVIYSDTANTVHTPSLSDTPIYVDKSTRSYFKYGVPANKYYTFGVFAYRIVDTSVNSAGILRSNIVKSTFTGENPYQPSASVAFGGNITGTVNGVVASTVTSQASNGQDASNKVNIFNATDNLCPNPIFDGGSSTFWTSTVVVNTTTGVPATAPTAYVGKQNSRDANGSGWFHVNPSETFYCEAFAATLNSTNSWGIGIQFQDASGNNSWILGGSLPSTTSTWTKASGVVTVPANAVRAIVWTQINATSAFGDWYFTKVIVKRQTTANVVQDGTLTSTKLDSPSQTKLTNGDTAFSGTTTYRDTTVPNGTFTCSALTHTVNTDGSVDITIPWTFAQGSVRADGFMLVYEKGQNIIPVAASPSYVQDLTTTKFILSGVPADIYHNFKIYSYRTTNTGLVIGTLANDVSWLNYRPSATVNYIGNVNGTAASTVQSQASNSVQIGSSYSSVIINNTDGVKATHANGDYTQLNGAGLKRYVASSGASKEFNYLVNVGSGETGGVGTKFDSGGARDANGSSTNIGTVWVQLPSDFNGKTFTVALAYKGGDPLAYAGVDGESFYSHYCPGVTKLFVKTYDYTNGKFEIEGWNFYYHLGSDSALYKKYHAIEYSYMAVV